jgi:hypothetical protein
VNNSSYRPTDAEVVAGWASDALRDGRYHLGHILAKIATQAQQHEARVRAAERAVNVPLIGQTREERPVRDFYDPRPNGHLTVINGHGPTGHGAQDLAATEVAVIAEQLQASAGQTAVFARPDTLADVPSPPNSRRCKAPVLRDGITDECHAVAYWSNDRNDWVHVDGSIDATHRPLCE